MISKLFASIAPANPDNTTHIVNHLTNWELAELVIGGIVLISVLVLIILHIIKNIKSLLPSVEIRTKAKLEKLQKKAIKISKQKSKHDKESAEFTKKLAELGVKLAPITPSISKI